MTKTRSVSSPRMTSSPPNNATEAASSLHLSRTSPDELQALVRVSLESFNCDCSRDWRVQVRKLFFDLIEIHLFLLTATELEAPCLR